MSLTFPFIASSAISSPLHLVFSLRQLQQAYLHLPCYAVLLAKVFPVTGREETRRNTSGGAQPCPAQGDDV